MFSIKNAMPKKGFRSITISAELYERLCVMGGPSKFANSLLQKKLKERKRLQNMMNRVEHTPDIVKVYV